MGLSIGTESIILPNYLYLKEHVLKLSKTVKVNLSIVQKNKNVFQSFIVYLKDSIFKSNVGKNFTLREINDT